MCVVFGSRRRGDENTFVVAILLLLLVCLFVDFRYSPSAILTEYTPRRAFSDKMIIFLSAAVAPMFI